ADAGAGTDGRGHWRASRRRQAQGPDQERARVAPGLAAGGLVPVACVAVETARGGARVRAAAAAALRQEPGGWRQEAGGRRPLGPIPLGAASAATVKPDGNGRLTAMRLLGRG